METLAQEWIEEGKQIGKREGIVIGKREGMIDTQRQVVQAMLANEYDLETVANLLNISTTEVLQLRDQAIVATSMQDSN